METIVNFINDYYIWFIIGVIVLVLALIGYYAEKNNLLKSDNEINDNIDNEPINKIDDPLIQNEVPTNNNLKEENINNNLVNNEPINKIDDPLIQNEVPTNNDLKEENIDNGLATDFVDDDLADAAVTIDDENKVTPVEPLALENEIASYEEPIIDNQFIERQQTNQQPQNIQIKNDSIENTEEINSSDLDLNNEDFEPVNTNIAQPIINEENNVASQIINENINNIFIEPTEQIENQNLNNDFNQANPINDLDIQNDDDENYQEEIKIPFDENNIVLEPEITDEEILSQTKDLDAIKEELNKIVFETNLDEKYLKNLNEKKDNLTEVDIKLPDINTLRLESENN